jgi:hypothetical protein
LALLLAGCASSNAGKKAASSEDATDNKPWNSESSGNSDSNSTDEGSGGSTKSDASPRINYTSENKLPPGPACLNQQGDVQDCMQDGDCCKNFYCGFDPEGNTRQKVCLYAGN